MWLYRIDLYCFICMFGFLKRSTHCLFVDCYILGIRYLPLSGGRQSIRSRPWSLVQAAGQSGAGQRFPGQCWQTNNNRWLSRRFVVSGDKRGVEVGQIWQTRNSPAGKISSSGIQAKLSPCNNIRCCAVHVSNFLRMQRRWIGFVYCWVRNIRLVMMNIKYSTSVELQINTIYWTLSNELI